MKKKYEQLVEALQKAISIPSVNPPGEEKEMCAFVENYLQQIPCEIQMQELSEGRKVIMAKISSGTEAPGLLFTGHMDVVPVWEKERREWETDPFLVQITDGKIFGRGAADMKSGLISSMVAFGDRAKKAKESGLNPTRDLFFVATVDEEDSMAGSKAVWQHPLLQNAKDVVVCEPTSLQVATASKGRTYGTLKIEGHTAHGSEFHPSSNAILIANEIINEMKNASFIQKKNLYGSSFWQVLAIRAGVEPCVVPDWCEMKFDARLVPGDETEKVWSEMEGIIENVRSRMGNFHVDCEIIDRREPWVTDEKSDFVKRVQEVYGALGEKFVTTTFPGTTDGTILRRGNRNILIFGPGNLKLAHRQNEYVELEEFFRAYEIYLKLME